jgi:poly-beta-1,6-N-acetyl-D-glucosamine synthase
MPVCLPGSQQTLNKTETTYYQLTIIVPAYNEVDSIADTIRSLLSQTRPPTEIIVVNDCSTDHTEEVARSCGVTVITPPQNTGSKAGAQNFALTRVETELTMAIDADTTLAPDAIEKLLPALDDGEVVAACGFVVPRYVRTMWERGRYIEYLFAFTFYKRVQDHYDKPLISSGCFSVYRTEVLRATGGWPTRTMAEDMDLTWSFYQAGHKIRFIPDAVCEPIEPHNFNLMRKQLRRWSHGFIQNVKIHWKGALGVPFLRLAIGVGFWGCHGIRTSLPFHHTAPYSGSGQSTVVAGLFDGHAGGGGACSNRGSKKEGDTEGFGKSSCFLGAAGGE